MNDLSRSLATQRRQLAAAFGEVLDAGWLVQGPRHRAFETELAAYVGVQDAVGVASGTDALELAMRALMPAGRDTVVTTANCGGYSTTAARRGGFAVRFAEIDAETLCMAPERLAEVLDERVGVVVVTHLYGRMADVGAVREACAPYGTTVLEDCAQALGACQASERAGGIGDAAAFSFYPTKNLGALGDAGAVASSRPEVLDRVRALRQYGWSAKYTIESDGGRNSRLDEVQAAFLSVRLANLDAWNSRRREILAAYAASASPRLRVLPADGPHHVGHLGVVIADDREALRAHLAAHGIRTDVHYPVPDHLQPVFAADHVGVSLPVTEDACRRVLSVPVFPELRQDEIDRVCDALAGY